MFVRTLTGGLVLEGEAPQGTTAVAETPQAETPEPPKSDAAPSPEASAESSGAGETPGLTWERLQAAGFTRESLDEILDTMPADERAQLGIISSARQEGAQTALSAETEAQKVAAEREEAYTTLIDQGRKGAVGIAARLKQALDDPENLERYLNRDTVLGFVADYAAGKVAEAAKESAKFAEKFQERYADVLGDLSADEKRTIREARQKDARAGSHEEQVFALADILRARTQAVAEEKGIQKGQRTGRNSDKTLEFIAQIEQAKGITAPSLKGKGAGENRRAELTAQIKALDPLDPEAESKMAAIKQQIDALPKE